MRPTPGESPGKFSTGWPDRVDAEGTVSFEDALYCGSRVGLERYDGRPGEAIVPEADEDGPSLHLDRHRGARERREAQRLIEVEP